MVEKLILIVLAFLIIVCNTPVQENEASTKLIDSGMVVSAHPQASKIGLDILKKGGNAVDAAVATGFALAVCYPTAGNIGGGGFMVFRFNDGATASIDFREKAPAKAGRDMFLNKSKSVVENMSLYTHAASGVPGSVDGMIEAHKKYGILPFEDVIQPAIELAKNGFIVAQKQAGSLNSSIEKFVRLNNHRVEFVKKKGMWVPGDTIRQPDLAKTLQLIKQKGRDGFYKGEVAEKIVAEMKRGNGLISLEDLKNYKSVWREPVTANYKGYKVISMAPPSSGGIALIQLLKMIEKFPVEAWTGKEDKTTHLMIEAMRRVYADRSEYLGDADFYKVPMVGLLDSAYIAGRMADFDSIKATPSRLIKPGSPKTDESEETTHYSVTDRWGNAVSVTTTINGGYGSHIVVKGAGFLLNNEMDDFSIKPGAPNMYGLIGGNANAIEPNKRMLSSMTPTIIEKDNKLFMVVGSPGGSTIITSVFQVIIQVIEKKMDMQSAVSAPRFHHQWMPDEVFIEEGRFEQTFIDKLAAYGHHIRTRGSLGRVDAILLTSDGRYQGGADPRGDDTALGY
jgi:gamma-glutamyltranspeptidase / glutathione hydrolase